MPLERPKNISDLKNYFLMELYTAESCLWALAQHKEFNPMKDCDLLIKDLDFLEGKERGLVSGYLCHAYDIQEKYKNLFIKEVMDDRRKYGFFRYMVPASIGLAISCRLSDDPLVILLSGVGPGLVFQRFFDRLSETRIVDKTIKKAREEIEESRKDTLSKLVGLNTQ